MQINNKAIRILKKELGSTASDIVLFFISLLEKKDSSYGIVKNGERWLRNTHSALSNKMCASISTIQRNLKKLINIGIIKKAQFDEGKNFYGGKNVCYFTVDFSFLAEFICSHTKENISIKMTERVGQNDRAISYKQSSNFKINTSTKTKIQKNHSTDHTASQVMFDYWNDIIQSQLQKKANERAGEGAGEDERKGRGGKISLTSKRSVYLTQAFTQCFDENMENWKSFCLKIAQSPFLMGEVTRKDGKDPFVITLDWALDFKNLDKILQGKYDKRVESSDHALLSAPQEIKMLDVHIPETLLEVEKNLRESILNIIGEGMYISWMQPTSVLMQQNGKPVLVVESDFVKNRFYCDYKLQDITTMFFDDVVVKNSKEHQQWLLKLSYVENMVIADDGVEHLVEENNRLMDDEKQLHNIDEREGETHNFDVFITPYKESVDEKSVLDHHAIFNIIHSNVACPIKMKNKASDVVLDSEEKQWSLEDLPMLSHYDEQQHISSIPKVQYGPDKSNIKFKKFSHYRVGGVKRYGHKPIDVSYMCYDVLKKRFGGVKRIGLKHDKGWFYTRMYNEMVRDIHTLDI